MAGWQTNLEDVEVIEVEEIIDTNPDLYKQNTIAALNERRYKEALAYAEKALEYGNNELQYQVLKVRVLYESQNYADCFKYLMTSGIWKNKDSKELLDDESNFLYVVFAECYHFCGGQPEKLDYIIVTPSGNGIYPTIQDAIDNGNASQKIFLTSGRYRECIGITRAVEIDSKSNFNAIIVSDSDTLTIDSDGEKVQISNISIATENNDETTVIQVASGSGLILKNVKVTGGETGVFIGTAVADLIDITVKSNKGGIGIWGGDVRLENSTISTDLGIGVAIGGMVEGKCFEPNVYINNTHITNCRIGLSGAPTDGKIHIYNCLINKNEIGISSENRIIEIDNSRIQTNRECNILCQRNSRIKLHNTKIAGSRKYGLFLDEHSECEMRKCKIDDNLVKAIEKRDSAYVYMDDETRQLNNDIAGWILGGIGRFFTT